MIFFSVPLGPFCGSSVPDQILSETEEVTIVFYSDKSGEERLNGELRVMVQQHDGK